MIVATGAGESGERTAVPEITSILVLYEERMLSFQLLS